MLPEEQVRTFWIEQMVMHWGYPRSLLLIEKELALLPHLSHDSKNIPKRRLDLLVYGKEEGNLFPLLMVECKAVVFNEQHIQQLLGYHAFVKSTYIALANHDHFLIAKSDELQFKEGLPHYNELLKK